MGWTPNAAIPLLSSLCASPRLRNTPHAWSSLRRATSAWGWTSKVRFIHVVIDQLYASLTSTRLNAKFFEAGFGFETSKEYGDLPTFHESVDEMRALSAGRQGACEERGERGEISSMDVRINMVKKLDVPAGVQIYEGSFDTPVPSTRKLLPSESKRAHVQYVVPVGHATAAQSAVVHLAATGDHGFSRRLLSYALPLATQHNVASVILESPFYGVRRPSFQNRSKLKTLSDLLLLGKATIEESLYILRWLEENAMSKEGNAISGVSMGGVHACMVASMHSLDDRDGRGLALVPLLAPRSASEAYCRGALRVGTSWDGLQVRILWYWCFWWRGGWRPGQLASPLAHLLICSLEPLATNHQRDFESRDMSKLLARIEHDMRPGRILSAASQDSWRLLERLKQAGEQDVPETHVLQLTELILNTYTDLTRFPPPLRADAAVVVGGSDDGYVGTQSVRDVGAHLAGSELRWVKGGHVSSFIMQHGCFVKAMADSLARL